MTASVSVDRFVLCTCVDCPPQPKGFATSVNLGCRGTCVHPGARREGMGGRHHSDPPPQRSDPLKGSRLTHIPSLHPGQTLSGIRTANAVRGEPRSRWDQG